MNQPKVSASECFDRWKTIDYVADITGVNENLVSQNLFPHLKVAA